MKEKVNNKKIIITTLIGIIALCLITLCITYAYWQINKNQTGENVVNTDCFNIEFVGENDILLNKAYPMTNEELKNFLATETPYTFTITNKCSGLAGATINMETVSVDGKKLNDAWIDALLYEKDYKKYLNDSKKLTGNVDNTENKVLEDSEKAYKLYNFTLKANETKTFKLLVYMDQDTPAENENMNATWKGKITLSSSYKVDQFENAGTLRQISGNYNGSNDTEKMWAYKDKITKLVIQNKIQDIPNKTYGPFDESYTEDERIKSYVVCEDGDTNCIGYLQGNGGIKLNEDSSYLFSNFTNLTKIEGMENLDTSNVTNMSDMFSYIKNLEELDLSNFDTSKVTNMSHMFASTTINKSINLKSFDTSHVTDMEYMFCGLTTTGDLNLINFDFSSLEISYGMFNQMDAQTLNLSGLDFSNIKTPFLDNLVFIETEKETYKINTVDISNVILPEDCTDFLNGMHTHNIILDDMDFGNVKILSGFFSYTTIDILDLSNIDLIQIIIDNNIEDCILFGSDIDVKEINLSNWNFYKYEQHFGNLDILNPEIVFSCNVYEKIDKVILNNIVFPENYTYNGVGGWLNPLSHAETIELKNVDISHTTSLRSLFLGFIYLTELDLSSFDTHNIEDMSYMFAELTNLERINYGNNFVYNDGMNIDGMFDNCKETLNKPNHSSWEGMLE